MAELTEEQRFLRGILEELGRADARGIGTPQLAKYRRLLTIIEEKEAQRIAAIWGDHPTKYARDARRSLYGTD